MNFDDLTALIEAVESSDLTDFSYEEGSFSLKLSAPYEGPVSEAREEPQEKTEEVPGLAPEEPADLGETLIEIYSPMIGVFISDKEDHSGPLVSTGDWVEEGQILCYIEAMQRKDEVRAPKDGTITSIHVASGESVEYGQELYSLKVVGSHD